MNKAKSLLAIVLMASSLGAENSIPTTKEETASKEKQRWLYAALADG